MPTGLGQGHPVRGRVELAGAGSAESVPGRSRPGERRCRRCRRCGRRPRPARWAGPGIVPWVPILDRARAGTTAADRSPSALAPGLRQQLEEADAGSDVLVVEGTVPEALTRDSR